MNKILITGATGLVGNYLKKISEPFLGKFVLSMLQYEVGKRPSISQILKSINDYIKNTREK